MGRGWLIAGLIIAATAGFSLGRFLPVDSEPTPSDPESTTSAPLSGKVTAAPPRPPAALANSVLAEEWNWFSKIRSATADELAALAEETESLEDRGMRVQMRRLIMERWLELDREAALAWATSHSNEEFFDSLFGEWATLNRDAAIAAAEALTDPDQQKRAYREICVTLAHGDDPEWFLSWINDLSQELVPQGLYRVAFTKLAGQDLETARRLAETIRGNPANMNSLRYVAEVWSDSDPEASIAWVKTFKNPDFTDQAMALIIRKIAATDPELAGREFQNLKNPRLPREPIVRDIVSTLTRNDPEAGVRWVNDYVVEGERSRYYDAITQAAVDGGADAVLQAMQAISASLPDNPVFGNSFRPDLSTFHGDPADFLSQLDGIPGNSAEQKMIRESLVGLWGHRDFEAAWNYASTASNPEERLILTQAALADASDPSAAWEKSQTLPESIRSLVQEPLLRNIVYGNLDLAMSKFDSLPVEQQTPALASYFASSLAKKGIRNAIEFTEALPPGPSQEIAWKRVVDTWSGKDPISLSEWADGLEAGGLRDLAASNLSAVLARDDPEAAFAWAAEIGPDSDRSTRIQLVLREWKKNDPSAAEAALLNSTGISESERQEFLQTIRQP